MDSLKVLLIQLTLLIRPKVYLSKHNVYSFQDNAYKFGIQAGKQEGIRVLIAINHFFEVPALVADPARSSFSFADPVNRRAFKLFPEDGALAEPDKDGNASGDKHYLRKMHKNKA